MLLIQWKGNSVLPMPLYSQKDYQTHFSPTRNLLYRSCTRVYWFLLVTYITSPEWALKIFLLLIITYSLATNRSSYDSTTATSTATWKDWVETVSCLRRSRLKFTLRRSLWICVESVRTRMKLKQQKPTVFLCFKIEKLTTLFIIF